MMVRTLARSLLQLKERRGVTTKEWRSDNKRVLLLGAGMVAEPVVEYLTRSGDVKITVGKSEVRCCRSRVPIILF